MRSVMLMTVVFLSPVLYEMRDERMSSFLCCACVCEAVVNNQVLSQISN